MKIFPQLWKLQVCNMLYSITTNNSVNDQLLSFSGIAILKLWCSQLYVPKKYSYSLNYLHTQNRQVIEY